MQTLSPPQFMINQYNNPNKLIKGPSFQLRVDKKDNLFARNNGLINENIVLKIGTPRIQKELKEMFFHFYQRRS